MEATGTLYFKGFPKKVEVTLSFKYSDLYSSSLTDEFIEASCKREVKFSILPNIGDMVNLKIGSQSSQYFEVFARVIPEEDVLGCYYALKVRWKFVERTSSDTHDDLRQKIRLALQSLTDVGWELDRDLVALRAKIEHEIYHGDGEFPQKHVGGNPIHSD